MNNQLQTIDNEQFGQMINLPTILQENRASTQGATLATQKLNEKFSTIKILEAPIEKLNEMDAELSGMQLKLNNTVKKQEDKRKPYTKFFDDVRALFTSEEKAVSTLSATIESNRKLIALEIKDRKKKADDAQAKAINKANEEIRIRAEIKEQYHAFYSNWSFSEKSGIRDRFYELSIESLQALNSPGIEIENVPKFNFSEKMVSFSFHDTVEVLPILTQEVHMQSNIDYINEVLAYFNSLFDLIPSRINELKAIEAGKKSIEEVNERINNESQVLIAEQLQANNDRVQASAILVQSAQLENTFDTIAATPIIEQNKGISIKKKYQPVNHAGHIAIMQWWIANVMPKLSVDELQTKLSFMRTAADKALNEGVEIKADGLNIIDDVKTRTR